MQVHQRWLVSSEPLPVVPFAFSTTLDPKRLTIEYIYQKKEKQRYIAVGDVQRNKNQAPIIARLTCSLCTTKIARIGCYTMLRTCFLKCKDVQNTITSALEGCGREGGRLRKVCCGGWW